MWRDMTTARTGLGPSGGSSRGCRAQLLVMLPFADILSCYNFVYSFQLLIEIAGDPRNLLPCSPLTPSALTRHPPSPSSPLLRN